MYIVVLQVLVRSDGSGDKYGNVSVDLGSVVSADLLLDQSQQHIYVLTNSRVRDNHPQPPQPPPSQLLSLFLCCDVFEHKNNCLVCLTVV